MNERADRIQARLEIPMLVASALVIPLIIIEQQSSSANWQSLAKSMNWVVWLTFVAEAVIMLSVVTSRSQWLKRHPLEVLVVIGTAPILPAALQAFRAIRILRLTRLLLLAKKARSLFTARGLNYAAVLSLVTILTGGAALRIAEPSLGLTFTDSVFWALTTATTVGYGDMGVPLTPAGRLIAAVVMIVGIGFIALLTAAMARQFLDEPTAEAKDVDDELVQLVRGLYQRIDELEARSPD